MKNQQKANSMIKESLLIDKAIEKMDMEEIDRQLRFLEIEKPLPCDIEESELFARRIIKEGKKGEHKVQNKSRRMGIMIAVVMMVLTLGVTMVFGAGYLKFDFFNHDTTVQIKTSENLTVEEAEALATEASEEYNNNVIDDAIVLETTKTNYNSIEELENDLEVKVVIPKYIPEGFVFDGNIMVQLSDISKNIYITYINGEEKMIGITMVVEEEIEGTTVSVTDAVYKDSFKTESGTEYMILDEDGAKIATTEVGNLSYAIVTIGVSDEVIQKILESIDFDDYLN